MALNQWNVVILAAYIINIDGPSKFWDYQLPIIGIIAKNMPLTSTFLLSYTKSMIARETNSNQGQTLMDF